MKAKQAQLSHYEEFRNSLIPVASKTANEKAGTKKESGNWAKVFFEIMDLFYEQRWYYDGCFVTPIFVDGRNYEVLEHIY